MDTTAELEFEVKFLAQSLAYLLECTLATYEAEALKTKPKKSFLDRHEAIIKGIVFPQHKAMAKARQSSSFAISNHRLTPRVDKILEFIANGDDSEAACCRYFNQLRYGTPAK